MDTVDVDDTISIKLEPTQKFQSLLLSGNGLNIRTRTWEP